MPVPNCLDYCGFVVELDIGERDPPPFYSSLSGLLWLVLVFVVPYELLNYLLQFVEECCWYFDRDCIESVDCFRQDGHFDDIKFFLPKSMG